MYHLLFVDDDLDTAREYAEQVANFTNLRPYVCSTKAEALEAVQKYPIGVAVLDQKMPEISGTQLFAELRKIAPRMRAIMLSGEADQTEIGEAMNLGYQKYLHKSDFRKLPQLVLKEFSRYQTEAARSLEFERVYLFKVANFFGLRGTIEFWLEAIFVEDEAFVPNDSWVLIDQVNCGEKKTITERYTRGDRF